MGGGGGGGPGSWKRWRELGVRVLVLGRRSHFHTSASSRNCPGDVKTDAVCLASSSHSPVPSNASIRRGLGHVQNDELTFLSFSPCLVQMGRASSSSASNFAGKNATGFGLRGPGVSARSQSSCCQSWHHPSKEGCTQNWARSGLGMSTDVRDECRHLPDVPSTEAQDQQVEHLNVPFHDESPTSSRLLGKGRVEASEGAFDEGNGVKFVFRTGQLRFHSTVPSRIQQRLGEATPVSLQELATALPDSDFVDWQQQRAARVKDSDIRHRPAPRHSSRSDAEPDDIFIPVKAFYISRSVDLKSLAREPFLEVTSSRNNLIIRCADRPPHSPVTADNPEMACLGFLKERYMVAFQYGSVVFFNFGDHEEVESLEAVRKYCTDDIRETRKDDYGVLVRPTLEEWSEGGHDRVMLRKLDIDNIRVISSVLGQSIALDHYAKKVDEMVTTFSDLNRGMEQSGTFTMTRKSLFQLVAAANTTLADVILRLGLLEKSDAAWKDANYAQIWEYLRDDFELDDRFENLDFKLNIIQHNVRFFLEILQNRKSDTLEWIIILLITGEICVSLYDILHTAGAI